MVRIDRDLSTQTSVDFKKAKNAVLGLLTLLVTVSLLAAPTQAAEVVGIDVVNRTEAGFTDNGSYPSWYPLGVDYTDSNQGTLTNAAWEANGRAQHRTSFTKAHTSTNFSSRLLGSAITHSEAGKGSWHHVKFVFDTNVVIDAREDEYWELFLYNMRNGAGSTSYGGLSYADNKYGYVHIDAAIGSVQINHASAAIDSGTLTLGTGVINQNAAHTLMNDQAQSYLSGTGPATVTVTYTMRVSVGAKNMIPRTLYRMEAAFRMGLGSNVYGTVLGRYPGSLSNGWYTQSGAQQVRNYPQYDGIFVYGFLQDTDADGITPDVDNCPNTYNDDQLDTDGDGVGDACAPPPPADGAEIVGVDTRNRTTGHWSNVYRYRDGLSDLNLWAQDSWHPKGFNEWRSYTQSPSIVYGPEGSFTARFRGFVGTQPFGGEAANNEPQFLYETDVMIEAAEGEYWEMELSAYRVGSAGVTQADGCYVNIGQATPTLRMNYGNATLKSGSLTLPAYDNLQGSDFPMDEGEKVTGVLSGIGPASVTLKYTMSVKVKATGSLDGSFLGLVKNEATLRMGVGASSNMTNDKKLLTLGVYPGQGSRSVSADGFYVKGKLLDVDPDDDGLANNVDNCPLDANAPEVAGDPQLDGDGDGAGDACDNCLDDYNPYEADTDGDGLADQPDSDGDGIGTVCDVCNGVEGAVGTWEIVYDLSNKNLPSNWKTKSAPTGNASTGSLLNIKNTPFNAGDRDPGPIGDTSDGAWGFNNVNALDPIRENSAGWSPDPAEQPSQLTLVFKDDGTGNAIDMNNSRVFLKDYRMSTYFAAGSDGAAFVYTHFDYTAGDGPSGPAVGNLNSTVVSWISNLHDYHTGGWMHCVGGLCSLGGLDEDVTYYKDFIFKYPGAEYGMRLNNFLIGGDLQFGTSDTTFTMGESEVPNPPGLGEPETSSNTYLYLKGWQVSRHYFAPEGVDDEDVDGIECDDDNCYDVPNPYDVDTDGDGIFDAQSDINGDGLGDACQNDDPDRDGWPADDDNCPGFDSEGVEIETPQDHRDPLRVNSDTDEHGDVCDNCALIDNSDQADVNGDGQGDVCQKRDRDNDGWPNVEDNCGFDYNNDQADIDCDGIGDVCDADNATPWAAGIEDTDGDGICDDNDLCFGDEATGDIDEDGVCDDSDICSGDDATGDTDLDGICDDNDECNGDDAIGDGDGDGVCDDIDPCPVDNPDDTDGDGVCDDVDVCTGDDITGDADDDGYCDDLDACAGDDASGDTDGDAVCDDIDTCLGDDATGDTDGDDVCDDIDACNGDDASGNDDGDINCNDSDVCKGADESGDTDADTVCDDSEECPGADDFADTDSNGLQDCLQTCALADDDDGDDVCNSADICPGLDDNVDDEANGVPDCLELACLVGDETLNQKAVNATPWASDATVLSLSPLGQGFVPQQPTLRAIEFWLHDIDTGLANDPMQVIVHEGAIDGPVVATSVDVTPFDGVFTSGMVRFDFPADIDVVVGNLYVFEVVAPNGRAGPAHWDAANPYPAGDGYIWGGLQNGAYAGTGVYDFGFETISAREGLTRGGDTDQDTICDDVDQCEGEDDTIDLTPANGTPDCVEDPCAALGGDADADGFCDGGEDLCPDSYNADNTDTNGDGIADDCQCGDINGDGSTNNDDVTEILLALWGYGAYTQPSNNWALCDVTGDGNCNNDDVTEILLPLWGYGAYNSPTVRWSCPTDSSPPVGLP